MTLAQTIVEPFTGSHAATMPNTLLGPRDPAPVNLINGDGASPVVLTCDHAGRAVPEQLDDLGLPAAEMDRHIAYDIGAAALANRLSDRLDAALVTQSYSRLVIDCNRHPSVPDSILGESDGTKIPANRDLHERDRTRRHAEIHQPYHEAIAELLDARATAARRAVLFSVHSFTPTMAGKQRPWHAGILFNRDPRLSHALMPILKAACPNLTFDFNEPYSVSDISDYTIPVHGETRGIPHALVEVRNDEIGHEDGLQRWTDLLADAVHQAAEAILREAKANP